MANQGGKAGKRRDTEKERKEKGKQGMFIHKYPPTSTSDFTLLKKSDYVHVKEKEYHKRWEVFGGLCNEGDPKQKM